MAVPCCIRIFVLELVQVVAVGYIVHSMGSSLWHTPQCGILELRCDAGNQPSATFLQFLRCVPRLQTCALPPPNHDQIIPAMLATLHTRLILCFTRPQSQSIEPHHLCSTPYSTTCNLALALAFSICWSWFAQLAYNQRQPAGKNHLLSGSPPAWYSDCACLRQCLRVLSLGLHAFHRGFDGPSRQQKTREYSPLFYTAAPAFRWG
jgi:hypothetical protein